MGNPPGASWRPKADPFSRKLKDKSDYNRGSGWKYGLRLVYGHFYDHVEGSAFGLQEAPGGFPRARSEKELLEMEPGKFFNDFKLILNRFLN